MKINRMLEIITILLNRKMVTASELAERFEVSIRTIYRDVDALSEAGIPVYTVQGNGGGISIMEEYALNRMLLSDNEKNNVLFALKTLQSTKYPDAEQAFEKLNSIFRQGAADWIRIDFSPWGANPNQYDKFVDIRTAILQGQVIEIDYINSMNKKSTRLVEPMRMVFKSQAWYLWGYCRMRNSYRTFRVSRIKRVVLLSEHFDQTAKHSELPAAPDAQPEDVKPMTRCVLTFTDKAMYRLNDDYNEDMLRNNGDGTYTVELVFPEDDWLYGYILSFGENVRVDEPEHLRRTIQEKIEKMFDIYR